MDPSARAIDGRVMSWMFVSGAELKEGAPVAGKRWIFTANTSARIGPITNAGIASMPKVDMPARRSNNRFGRRDATSARGMAIANEMIWEYRISSRSNGKAFADGRRHVLMVEEGLAEIPVEDVLEPDPVLVEKGFVQAQLFEQCGAVLRGLVRPEDRVDGGAGQ